MRLVAKGGDADMDVLATLVGTMMSFALGEFMQWI